MNLGGIVVILVPLSICAWAAWIDLRTREIPNRLPLLLLAALFLRLMLQQTIQPTWQHLCGGVLALTAGCVLARADRFGGGDVKLFAVLGAWYGIYAIPSLAMWIAIAGLPLAVIAAARKQISFAYGPAIFIGVCVQEGAPHLLQQIALR